MLRLHTTLRPSCWARGAGFFVFVTAIFLATAAISADDHPFAANNPVPMPDFPPGYEWVNVKTGLNKASLKGKFVVIDFWTYCCINCIHTLPELKKLEQAFPNELVVIGVQSGKFATERDAENLSQAVMRYEIEHPVVNDPQHQLWGAFGVSRWPTIFLIDPEGNIVAKKEGESKMADIAPAIRRGLPYYRKKGLLNEKPLKFDLAASRLPPTPLRFPGKVLADEATKRLFIADSNHNRIVVASLEGKLLAVIGSGQIGRNDGDFASSSFNKPQGLALKGDLLYVADTENHLLRKVDLAKKTVETIAGTGVQIKQGITGIHRPKQTALGSPWDLCIHEKDLYIAMAGPHQIWKMKLDESDLRSHAGNGMEDIVDGPMVPRKVFQTGYASFAQPSGLATDGKSLFVADSEGSSIRRVPLDPKRDVETVIGTSQLPAAARLFTFGDRDGEPGTAFLQHPLGVAYVNGKLYVADTYNNKIRAVDPRSGTVSTFAGTGKPGSDNAAPTFDEPAGISNAFGKLYVADTNNHVIRTIDIKTGQVGTFEIAGLAPPSAEAPAAPKKPTFPGAVQVKAPAVSVRPTGGKIKFEVEIELPPGWKANPTAPASYYPEVAGETGPLDRSAVRKEIKLPRPATTFEFSVPTQPSGDDLFRVSLNYYYCQEKDNGVCKVGAVAFTVPLKISPDGTTDVVKFKHAAAE